MNLLPPSSVTGFMQENSIFNHHRLNNKCEIDTRFMKEL
jgi:hypothetical protein